MLIYDLLILILSPLIFSILLIKYRRRKKIIKERFYLEKNFSEGDFLWFQAASIGEVKLANLFSYKIRKLYPSFKTILSSQTYEGLREGKFFDEKIITPLDISFVVRSFLKKIRIKKAIFFETEIWPNLINYFYKKNIEIFLLNARISKRTFPFYKIIKFFFPKIFKRFKFIVAKSEEEKRRFEVLGAKNVFVGKNLKYDLAVFELERKFKEKRDFGFKNEDFIITWGSMRGGEEDLAINVFEKLKERDVIFIYVPRHIEKTYEVAEKLKNRKIDYSIWPEKSRFILVEKTGILLDIYNISDIVVVGGAFKNFGGQNFLEAGILGKPTIIGKNYHNFSEIVSELKENLFILEENEVFDKINLLIEDKNLREKYGRRLKEEIIKRSGEIEKNIKIVLENA